jgi:hypothetical protein
VLDGGEDSEYHETNKILRAQETNLVPWKEERRGQEPQKFSTPGNDGSGSKRRTRFLGQP